MHTHSVLQKFFAVSLPAMHARRRDAVVAAVESVSLRNGVTHKSSAVNRAIENEVWPP